MVPGMVFHDRTHDQYGTPPGFLYQFFQRLDSLYLRSQTPSAQWELTVLVTEQGHEVLTW